MNVYDPAIIILILAGLSIVMWLVNYIRMEKVFAADGCSVEEITKLENKYLRLKKWRKYCLILCGILILAAGAVAVSMRWDIVVKNL